MCIKLFQGTKFQRTFVGLCLIFLWVVGGTGYAQDGSEDEPRAGTTTSYTTITSVKANPLSNGVQIVIRADGILQYRQRGSESGQQIALYFPQARNGTGKNFININRYPVSHIALTTPQGAVSGIGLNVVIYNLTAARSQISAGPDNQSVLITVLSDRTIEGRPSSGTATTAATDPNRPDTSTKVEFADGKLTVRAVKADIHSLVGLIVDKTGLVGAVDDAVDKKVTINLSGVAPEVAV